jgi:mRNA guanylyltransferase
MNVEFCNTKAYLIDSKDLKEKVFLECESLFGKSLKRDYFPGPQPVAIERKNLPLKDKYMVCEKSDGERAILLLLQINNKPMCFMINRKNEFYFIDISFKKEVFEGSIFDGELIKNKEGSWNYLIHDCMAYNGTSFLEFSHRLRYACIIDLIVKRYNNKSTDCINIKTKLFYDYGPELIKTWDHIQETTENKIDGLIFTPVYGPIIFGRDYTLLKWKEINSIDFLAKIVKGKLNLYYYKKILTVYKSFKPESENYKNITNFIKNNKIFVEKGDLDTGIIIEFKISNDLGIFTPYRIRSDKLKPNGEITVNNTLKNIQESLDIKDLV